MSNNITRKELLADVSGSGSRDLEDFQILSALYRHYVDQELFRLPAHGEVAREEHVTAPLEHIQRQSQNLQDQMGYLLTEAETLDSEVKRVYNAVQADLDYLKSESNYWKLQRGVKDNTVLEFYESFNPGLTLEEDTTVDQIGQLDVVEYVPADSNIRSGSGKLPHVFTAFGKPFDGITVEDAADELKNQKPVSLQRIALKTPDTGGTNVFLTTQLENPNNLNRVPTAPFVWHQEILDDLANLMLNGYLRMRFTSPVRMSFLQLLIQPEEVVETVSIYNENGYETVLPMASKLYFAPQRVSEIRLHIQDNISASKLAYLLTAFIVVTANTSGAPDYYVYYRDLQAKSILENL